MQTKLILLFAAGLAASCLAAPSLYARDSEKWPVREQSDIRKTLTLSGSPNRLVIDNVSGFVHVTGIDGSQVRVTAHKTVRADSDSDLQESKEVNLDITEKPGSVDLYYSAPWRCDGDHRPCETSHHRRFYNVTYDIEVEAPRDAHIIVSTVNDGDLRVERTNGPFEISNINGGISMKDISGSGSVHDINGPVTVTFARNPNGPTSFNTLNGEMNVYFQPGLSADLSFKTFNGQIYSDFDVTPRATPAGSATASTSITAAACPAHASAPADPNSNSTHSTETSACTSQASPNKPNETKT